MREDTRYNVENKCILRLTAVLTLDHDEDGPKRAPFAVGEEDIGLQLLRSKAEQIWYENNEKRNCLKFQLDTGRERT